MPVRLVAIAVLIVAFAFAAPVAARNPTGKKLALLVGVKSYDHSALSDLTHTERDVEELGKLFRAGGFDEVVVLTTTRGGKDSTAQPTADNIRKQLARILSRINKHDLVIVALAGHGLQLRIEDPRTKAEREESFFLASDARPRDTKELATLAKTMIPLTELFKELEGSGAGVKLMLVDACRNDPKLGRSMDAEALPRPSKGTGALFSCKGGEKAYESDKLGGGHGVFFHFVLEGLKGKAKNERGEITWSRLAEYVTEKVADEVPHIIKGGARQTPQEMTNIIGKSPILFGKPAAKVETAKLDPAEIDRLYQRGFDLATGQNGVKQDEAEAARLFRQIAPSEHQMAMFWLGWMHENGKGVGQDLAEAARWYRLGANKGHAAALNNLGWLYESGRGVNKDASEAIRLYKMSADLDHAMAMRNLGRIHEQGDAKIRNGAEAVRWYKKAATTGDLFAIESLGLMHRFAKGIAKDDQEAVKWFRKAAEMGHAASMNNLGLCYERGEGVEKDLREAFGWYKKAAELGDYWSTYNMGVCYMNGIGVARDDAEAIRWYKLAIAKGHPAAMSNMGWMHENGRGFVKDIDEALRWYRKAAEKGDDFAKKAILRLTNKSA